MGYAFCQVYTPIDGWPTVAEKNGPTVRRRHICKVCGGPAWLHVRINRDGQDPRYHQ